jgi:Hypervirulence associated proteins TUDOR domain
VRYQQRCSVVAEKTFSKGDKVVWESSGGHSVGKVVQKLTSPTKIKGHKVAASKDNPEYLVESDKSGGRAAHKPASLKKA